MTSNRLHNPATISRMLIPFMLFLCFHFPLRYTENGITTNGRCPNTWVSASTPRIRLSIDSNSITTPTAEPAANNKPNQENLYPIGFKGFLRQDGRFKQGKSLRFILAFQILRNLRIHFPVAKFVKLSFARYHDLE